MAHTNSITVSRGDVWWSFGALLLHHSAPFILLPVVMHYLSAEELGIWYAYQLAGGLAVLLEFGYQSTFFRNLAYVAGGAKDLQKEGTPASAVADMHGTIDYGLLSSLITAMRRRYVRISLIIVATLATVGTTYVAYVSRGMANQIQLAPSWAVFVAASVVGFYLSHYNTILYAFNHVRAAQKFQVAGRALSVACSCAFLYAGLGLVGATLGYFVGQAVPHYLSLLALKRIDLHQRAISTPPSRDLHAVDDIIWHNARKFGISMAGVFVTQRGTAFVVSLFLSLPAFAAFSITLQVLHAISNLARVKLQVAMAALSMHAGRAETRQFRQLFMSCLKIAVLVYLWGALMLLLVGQDVLSLFTDTLKLVDRTALLLLILLYLLEVIHGYSSWGLTCFNTIPFVWPNWLTGAAIIASSLAVGLFTDWGVTGFVAVQLLCQVAYNAWKWPLELNARCAARPAVASTSDA